MAEIKIPFNKPFIEGKELYYISQAVIEYAHLSGDGPFTKKCQAWLEENLDCHKVLLTHSCTAALEMAAMLCNVNEGDEVIMPSFTFVSTANAFVLRGATPVFVDIRSDTLNINEKLIEEAITPKTKVIVPVHYAGVGCDMASIMKIAEMHEMFVVEDAAQALLSTHDNHFLGTIGHFGTLSFHETKNVISGEGGALLINDKKFDERAEILREKGTNRSKFFRGEVDKYTWVDKGSSYLPSELVGAFLFAQLERAAEINAKRCNIFDRYYEGLRELEKNGHLRLPFVPNKCDCNSHIFYIIIESLEIRTKLIEYLKTKNILSVFHYVPLHSSPAGKKYCRTSGSMTVTDDFSERILRLPLYFDMQFDEVDKVLKNINDFFSS